MTATIDTVSRIYLTIMEAGHQNLVFNEDTGRGYATVRLAASKAAALTDAENEYLRFVALSPASLHRLYTETEKPTGILKPFAFYHWWRRRQKELFEARCRAVSERASLKAKIDVINGLAEKHYNETKINWRIGLTDDEFALNFSGIL